MNIPQFKKAARIMGEQTEGDPLIIRVFLSSDVVIQGSFILHEAEELLQVCNLSDCNSLVATDYDMFVPLSAVVAVQ